MSTLTKDQLERLTPEQQKDVAVLELRRVERRERLLKQAHRSRVHLFMHGAGLVVVLCVAVYARVATPLLFCIGGLAIVVGAEVISAHRRIDALLELVQADDNAG